MLELETPIIFNKKIAARTYLMGIRSEDLAAQAKPGQFVMIRVSPTIDPPKVPKNATFLPIERPLNISLDCVISCKMNFNFPSPEYPSSGSPSLEALIHWVGYWILSY